MFVRSNWKSLLFVLNELCNVFSRNGALVAWRSVELATKLSLFRLVEILRCSAFTAAVKLEMSVLSFLVMATPRKENKRCHLTTGQTPKEKKRNQPGGQIQGHIGSRKSLDYDSVEQLGNSITAQGRVSLPPLVFCLPSRRKTSNYNIVYYAFVMTMQFEMAKPK